MGLSGELHCETMGAYWGDSGELLVDFWDAVELWDSGISGFGNQEVVELFVVFMNL